MGLVSLGPFWEAIHLGNTEKWGKNGVTIVKHIHKTHTKCSLH